MYDLKTKQAVVRKLAEGQSIRTVAAEMGISPTTVCHWNKEFAAEIAKTRRWELNAALAEFGAAQPERIKALAFAFSKVAAHLEAAKSVSRNSALYSYLLKLDKRIDEELHRALRSPV